MGSFDTLEFQRILALLILSFTVTVFLFGLLINKYKFFDNKRKPTEKKSNKVKDSRSEIIGTLMMACSGIVFFTALLVFVLSYFTD